MCAFCLYHPWCMSPSILLIRIIGVLCRSWRINNSVWEPLMYTFDAMRNYTALPGALLEGVIWVSRYVGLAMCNILQVGGGLLPIHSSISLHLLEPTYFHHKNLSASHLSMPCTFLCVFRCSGTGKTSVALYRLWDLWLASHVSIQDEPIGNAVFVTASANLRSEMERMFRRLQVRDVPRKLFASHFSYHVWHSYVIWCCLERYPWWCWWACLDNLLGSRSRLD